MQKLMKYGELKAEDYLRSKKKIFSDEQPIYIVYVRKSTKGEEKQERSIPDQLKLCKKISTEKKLKVYDFYEEKGSAFISDNRPVFRQILNHISKSGGRKYNSILAFSPDRLSRNMKEAGEIIDLLHRGQMIDLQFSSFPFMNNSDGLMSLGIHFVLAKQYSDNVSMHTNKGIDGTVEEGKGLAHPKWGYKFASEDLRLFRPDGRNFHLIQKAFVHALEGKSLEEIAVFLNTEGFEFKGKKIIVTKNRLSSMFANPFYAGVYVSGSKVIEMGKADPLFEPVMSPKDFFRIRELYKDRNHNLKPNINNFLLRGMVFCNYCQKEMKPGKPKGNGGRYLRFACTNKRCPRHTELVKGTAKKFKREIRAKIIFEFVDKILKDGIKVDQKLYSKFLKAGQEDAVYQLNKLEQDLKITRKKITETNNKINSKLEMFERAEKKDVGKRIEKQIQELEEELTKLLDMEIKLEADLQKAKEALKQSPILYEDFVNLFEYSNGVIQNSDNQYFVDWMLRQVFMNFYVDSTNVVTYQLNPMFENYLKVGNVLDGVNGWKRFGTLLIPITPLVLPT